MKRLDLSPEQRLIYNTKQKIARAAVRQAVKKGWMVKPSACEECGQSPKPDSHGKPRLEGAHYSYDRPLDVRWLCTKCHRAWDSNQTNVDDLEKLLPRPVHDPYRWDVDHGYSMRALRRQTGVTQSFLASAAGVSQAYVSKMENGESSSAEMRQQVLGALGQIAVTQRSDKLREAIDSRLAILRRSSDAQAQDEDYE